MQVNKEIIIQKLRSIKPQLEKKYNLTELSLFGSYARDEQKPGSDIDILVSYSPKNYKNFLYSIDEIERLFPGIEIQAVIRGAIRPQYFETIKQDLIYA